MAVTDPDTIQAARIAAQATVDAARIAAGAARFGSLVTAGTALVAFAGAVTTAVFAYRSSRRPIEQQERLHERDDQKVRARLEIPLTTALAEAERAIADFEGDFAKPVSLRVLNLSGAGDKHDFSVLGGPVVAALARVERAESAYRAAKDPFQREFGNPGHHAPPAQLIARPNGFETVLGAAKSYRTALRQLKNRLKAA